MMRKVQVLFVLLLLPLLSWAKTSVNASEIINKINRGQAVSYSNAEIVGDLDLTKLKNMKQKSSKGSKEYISTVTSMVTFMNCTFKGDVLAYYNPDNAGNVSSWFSSSSNETYNTNFEEDVRFENCVFEKKSAFKYSKFNGNVSFAGSRFSEEALFKYSDFSESVNFSNVMFSDDANFKYVDFPVMADFGGATFEDEANFKYAKFKEGVSFRRTAFEGLANFKYTKISDAFEIRGASFKGGDDFKYTQVNNKHVSLTTLQSMAK
ncbi:pentapeptide repeat-containing protein [Pontibacter silvestris]|uniref:Pentapeptide repeat-containing protein n=1 Tax=Pontibacter silvestris TaxID=2305183 RepID=A0ABW4WZ76_9BACT|nr:pentapeptide repeat-containing protein [Pontibacter silvestris]MCC9136864.1 pentapeptide repeat-containing protein [Pontibacter silvestris]